ncbi:MAG: hypothetical protein RLO08_03895 [Parvibaculaceae bacterium]
MIRFRIAIFTLVAALVLPAAGAGAAIHVNGRGLHEQGQLTSHLHEHHAEGVAADHRHDEKHRTPGQDICCTANGTCHAILMAAPRDRGPAQGSKVPVLGVPGLSGQTVDTLLHPPQTLL